MTTVVIASDHAGLPLKREVQVELAKRGIDVLDLGVQDETSVDYPDQAHTLAEAINAGWAEIGVLVCGTGIGVSIAANRHPGIRAAVCHDVYTATMARAHNNANILAMGARVVDPATAIACLDVFLKTEFEGGRHTQRIAKLDR
ncbi:ribose 5-phosphate isomerase B [Marinivivus vitaminiproducens]|uniref:ribose 5-phosphate isomerase B n=1 Tax=Marinivivus vitaminiproducens TaxID=3035935 RepID=UPI00279AD972|nr:ribose 5-phosphate isomerase B [Geminicoccaceae bacterium SCSIO 64248]